jgi:hypothetical protein
METLKKNSRGTDVRWLQQRLIDKGLQPGEVDGIFGQSTEDAVREFQTSAGLTPDGIAGRFTVAALQDKSPPPGQVPAPEVPDNFVPPATAPGSLTRNDVAEIAQELRCEAAAVWAVCDVESRGSGFLPDGRPKILFEAHLFGRMTDHQYDRSHPNISSPVWNHSLYGAGGAHQYDRLHEAMSLDHTAALESASWGMFQILGSNYSACGFGSVDEFVKTMGESEKNQLDAFARFCHEAGLVRYLTSLDWLHFALGYNGRLEAQNDYHGKLKRAYELHRS